MLIKGKPESRLTPACLSAAAATRNPPDLVCVPPSPLPTQPTMSSAANSYYFRRRTIGRAASPPTWACYEQIPYDDDDYSDSCSDSCSEDDDDYPRSAALRDEPISSDTDDKDDDELRNSAPADVTHAMDMDMDEDHIDSDSGRQKPSGESQKDVKGKQKVADPEPEDRKRNRKKHHRPMYALRPILTIHKSQGFVWNQASYLRLFPDTLGIYLRYFLHTGSICTPIHQRPMFVP